MLPWSFRFNWYNRSCDFLVHQIQSNVEILQDTAGNSILVREEIRFNPNIAMFFSNTITSKRVDVR